MAVGVASQFKTVTRPWWAKGEIALWDLSSEKPIMLRGHTKEVMAVAFSRDGESLGLLTSEKRQYVDALRRPTFEPVTEVGIIESARQDVYLVFE